jgi:hypothetical protein
MSSRLPLKMLLEDHLEWLREGMRTARRDPISQTYFRISTAPWTPSSTCRTIAIDRATVGE